MSRGMHYTKDEDVALTNLMHDMIRDTFFDTATLGEANGGVFLNINIPEIRRWFKEHEPEAFSECLEYLKLRKKAGDC